MCLAIPGQVIEFVDDANRLAKVDVAGVRRNVNVSLLDGEDGGAHPGDWVLIHVGFALSKVDEDEAHATLELLRGMGSEFEAAIEELKGERDRVSEALPACIADFDGCITCGDVAVELRVVSVDDQRGLAVCADETGGSMEVDVLLVAPVAPGEQLLVHAGDGHREGRVKFVDEFRDAELGGALAREILSTVEPGRHYKVMEVCGGHTHSIYKYGVDDLLPANVELVHGPGCPVCVIPMGRVDDGIAIAHEPGVIFTCFGDMLRVPGSEGTLLDAKAQGADIRMVYSPLDALRIARENPDRDVVFFAIGFETTAPSTALTLKRAKAEGVANFTCMCNHVTIVPPLRALLDSPDLRLDGFIGPGHVATVVGARPFQFIPADYGKPVVISGFEPVDLLQSVQMILRQLGEARCEVENQYSRVVPHEGNVRALEVMAEVFALRPHFEWRGLGFISQSALRLSDAYADFDAEVRYSVPGVRVADPKACQCGEVLKGVIKPWECKVFGSACTPEHAIGTCMVSPEGACAAYYNYGRFAREREVV